jgi:signal transduction histidine kinase
MRAGSGIGLYLTKLIVENYNGKIQLQSEVGKEQR